MYSKSMKIDRLNQQDHAFRNKTLDIYKGLLIILVILRHVLQYSVSDEGGILTNIIWAVQMPGFMLVSGYFAGRRIENWREAGKRILQSSEHYALPFFSWFILIDVLLLGNNGRNPITGLALLADHVDGGLWFLWVVFVLSIIATLADLTLSCKSGRIYKTVLVLLVYFGVLLLVGKMAGISFLGIKYILYYAIFYGLGWLVKWTEGWWRKWWGKASNTLYFISFLIFLAIVFNFDLYHADDEIVSIIVRAVVGFVGNLVIIAICNKYKSALSIISLDCIGMYTLEIYVTHMYVNNLMQMSNSFFTVMGFGNFVCSLTLTVLFTTIIIATIKSIPAANLIFYGKKR